MSQGDNSERAVGIVSFFLHANDIQFCACMCVLCVLCVWKTFNAIFTLIENQPFAYLNEQVASVIHIMAFTYV